MRLDLHLYLRLQLRLKMLMRLDLHSYLLLLKLNQSRISQHSYYLLNHLRLFDSNRSLNNLHKIERLMAEM